MEQKLLVAALDVVAAGRTGSVKCDPDWQLGYGASQVTILRC